MTVFLALTLTVVLSFLVTVIESARVNTIRFQIECAADMALYSALAEYHRELEEQYELFFIDTSYGQKTGRLCNTEEHIKNYLAYNLQPAEGLFLPGIKDFLALSANCAVIEDYSLATDLDCLVLKSQAVSCMKQSTGINGIEKLLENTAHIQKNHMTDGIKQQRRSLQAQIDALDHQRIQVSEEEWIEVEIDNPAEVIPIEEAGMIYQVTKDAQGLVNREIEPKNYVSGRELSSGSGMPPDREEAQGGEDEILFDEYLLKHCGYYTNQKEGSLLTYQIEYILCGKNQDLDNLKETVNRILMIREAANYAYLMQDGGKQAMAESAAAAVSAVLFIPEVKELIKQALLLGWAYTESVNDIKILLEKGKVPLLKTAENWHMGFGDMFHYYDCLGGGNGKAEGLAYEDYLRILLLLQNSRHKSMRFADIAEMDIRKTPQNQNFRLDECIDSMNVFMEVSSRYGYFYDIRRRYGYELLE